MHRALRILAAAAHALGRLEVAVPGASIHKLLAVWQIARECVERLAAGANTAAKKRKYHFEYLEIVPEETPAAKVAKTSDKTSPTAKAKAVDKR